MKKALNEIKIEELKNKLDCLKDSMKKAEMLLFDYLESNESCKIYDTIDKMKQQLNA